MSPFGVPVLRKFAKLSHVYTCHFGIEALMSHYLDKEFKAEYLENPASVRSEECYVKMMISSDINRASGYIMNNPALAP